jgi:hypothetical protein
LRAIFNVNQFTMCRCDYDHKTSFVPAGASPGGGIEFDWPLMIQPRFECTRRGCNQRIGIPATLVTPTVRFPGPNYLTINNER